MIGSRLRLVSRTLVVFAVMTCVLCGAVALAPVAHAAPPPSQVPQSPIPPDKDCLLSRIGSSRTTGSNSGSFGGWTDNTCSATMTSATHYAQFSTSCPYRIPGAGTGTFTSGLVVPWDSGTTDFWTRGFTARCYGCTNGKASTFPPFSIQLMCG
jgi:hypothetical protein